MMSTYDPLSFYKDKNIEGELVTGESEVAKGLPRVENLQPYIANAAKVEETVVNNLITDQMRQLTSEANVGFFFEAPMRQLAISNPTGRTIKIGVSSVNSTDYMFLVNANKQCVFPPFNFDHIYILQEGVLTGSIMPLLFAYVKGDIAPNISSIT